MKVSSVELRTAYNTAEWLVQWHGLRLSAASDTFAWVLVSTQKRVQHLAFWLFWFGVCGHWLLSLSPHGHLASASGSGYLATDVRYRVYKSHRYRKLQLVFSSPGRSTIKLDEGARKPSWRLKTHWDTCDCRPTPSIEISSVFSEISASDSARPSQVADRRRF